MCIEYRTIIIFERLKLSGRHNLEALGAEVYLNSIAKIRNLFIKNKG